MTEARHGELENAARTAVRLARLIASDWQAGRVDIDLHRGDRRTATLDRLSEGKVFEDEDESQLEQMLLDIASRLESFSPGYGQFFMEHSTAGRPFADPRRERVRLLGERFKAFRDARHAVIDAFRARRELDCMSGR